ncbi:MAG TPA: glycosyltransferase family 39 protein [Patescibacteria group bacterium]|nr:glycosyltransferase family 39 protein [Patescibacteria group bacterium]
MFSYLLMSVWFLYQEFRQNRLRNIKAYFKDPFLIFLVVLALIRGISIINSKNLAASIFLYSFFVTVVFLCFYLFVYFKNNQLGINKIIDFFTYCAFVLSVLGFFQMLLYFKTGIIVGALWNVPNNLPRVGTTFWDVNHYAALLAAFLPILGVKLLYSKNFKEALLRVAMIISMTASLFLTSSRTAWIMAFVSLLGFICILLVRKFGFRSILGVIICLILICVPLVREYNIKSSPFRAEIKQFFHYRLDSFASHIMLLTGTYQVFEKYPIIGGGYGSFFEHFSTTSIAPTFFGRDPAALNTRVPAHTIWGELMAETGSLGLIAFIGLTGVLIGVLIFAVSKASTRQELLTVTAMLATLMGWLIAGVFYSYNAEFFWIILILYYLYGLNIVARNYSYMDILRFFVTSKKFYALLIGILGLVLIFVGLGTNHLIPWDEAIYAKIAKNMVISGDYISQTWKEGIVWYEKPPLYMWLMALFMNIGGFTSLMARLPSALFGLGTVYITYLFGKKLFGKTVGFLSGLALLTNIHFLYYSRASMLDVTSTFFILASIYAYYLAYEVKSRSIIRFLIIGMLIGTSAMVKGVVGLFPLGVLAIFELVTALYNKSFHVKRVLLSWIVMLVGILLISLPWHWVMFNKYGVAFLGNYFGYHVWDRATAAIEDKGRPFWWYLIVMKVSMRLWFLAFLPGLVIFARELWKKSAKHLLLVVWFVLVFSLFSLAKSKLAWYVIPMYPATSIIAALFLSEFFNFIYSLVIKKHYFVAKSLFMFGVLCVSLFYLFSIRELAYTSDLTGSQSRLMQLKNQKFGVDQKLFADRIELPLVLFYNEGPYEILDFNPDRDGQLPFPTYKERTVLLTKKGRFGQKVSGFTYEPVVVQEDGDWVLWYFESPYEQDKDRASYLRKEQARLQELVLSGDKSYFQQYQDVAKELFEIDLRITESRN